MKPRFDPARGNAETVVIRVLGAGIEELKIETLGLRENTMQTLLREVQKPNGMILKPGRPARARPPLYILF